MLNVRKAIFRHDCKIFCLRKSTIRFTHNNAMKPNMLSKIVTKIKATGPISVFDYMQEVLSTPQYGYYASRPGIGPGGDFITSPEITQVFGELVGVWLVSEWARQGKPQNAQIVELGPGNGTLTKDILRILTQLKVKSEFSCVNLIENSPHFLKVQFESLCESENLSKPSLSLQSGISSNGVPIHWYSSVKDIPRMPSYFIANEFFDALPIHQFIKSEQKWKEILIDTEEKNGNKLRFTIPSYRTTSQGAYAEFFQNSETEKAEVNPHCLMITECISDLLSEKGAGSCLIIDYGYLELNDFTLRGFRNHKEWNVLLEPGTADLTADVNFDLIKKVANRTTSVHGPVSQNAFLHRMGIRERIGKMLQGCSMDERNSLVKSYEFLTSPQYMGERFKVLAMSPKGGAISYGFDS